MYTHLCPVRVITYIAYSIILSKLSHGWCVKILVQVWLSRIPREPLGGARNTHLMWSCDFREKALGCVVDEVTTQTKIFVHWDVDLEQAQRTNFEFEKSGGLAKGLEACV